MKNLLMVSITVVAVSMLSAGVNAQNFANKTVKVIVPSGSGGTYHVYCQLVQRNIGRHIPGAAQPI